MIVKLNAQQHLLNPLDIINSMLYTYNRQLEVTMFLTMQPNDKRPVYQQIVDGIKALIAHGDLGEGKSLPSVRQVAGDLGINLNTVAVAYRQLQDEGFVTVRHGAGAVIASRTPRRFERIGGDSLTSTPLARTSNSTCHAWFEDANAALVSHCIAM